MTGTKALVVLLVSTSTGSPVSVAVYETVEACEADARAAPGSMIATGWASSVRSLYWACAPLPGAVDVLGGNFRN